MYNNYYQPYMNRYGIPTQIPSNEQFNQQVQIPSPMYNQALKPSLQGKIVEGLKVVESSEIPYDGSISYFPCTDGKTIFTKQLQTDGNVRVFKYTLEEEKDEKVDLPTYATKEDIQGYFDSFKNELEEIKKSLKTKGKKEDE